jgi:putative holliday junction resolvase
MNCEAILAKSGKDAIGVKSMFCYTFDMKYLAIDYGTKRIGVATSDDGGRMAFPLTVVMNEKHALETIVELCRSERAGAIVVGESLNFQNEPNPIMKEVRLFAERLESLTGLPVAYMNEVLSSREAMHIQGDNDLNDASAAAIVLQSYLESIARSNS